MIDAPPGTERAQVLEAAISSWDDGKDFQSAILAADLDVDFDTLIPTFDGGSGRFQLVPASAALQPLRPQEWIVDQLISAGSRNIFYGDGGGKKTYAALDLAVCVADGISWLDMPTTQGSVLFIDEESGRDRYLRRLRSILQGHLIDWDIPLWAINLAGIDFQKLDDCLSVENLIIQTKAKLVFIDALVDIMPGLDENTVRETQPILLRLRKIAAQQNCAILLIHHSNKNGNYRGSTTLRNSVDCLVKIMSDKDSSFVSFAVEKNRDGEQFQFAASAAWTTSVNGSDQFTLLRSDSPIKSKIIISNSERFVLEYLADHKGRALIEQIKGSVDSISTNSVRKAVYRLSKRNLIFRSNAGGNGVSAEYSFVLPDVLEVLDSLGITYQYDLLAPEDEDVLVPCA